MDGGQAIGVQARLSGVRFDQSAKRSLVTVVNSDNGTFVRSVETNVNLVSDTELYHDFSIVKLRGSWAPVGVCPRLIDIVIRIYIFVKYITTPTLLHQIGGAPLEDYAEYVMRPLMLELMLNLRVLRTRPYYGPHMRVRFRPGHAIFSNL